MRSLGPFFIASSFVVAFAACAAHEEPVEDPHAAHGKGDDSHHGTPDPQAVHGMAFFGGETLFASHLPMFHRPHDYQVLLEVAVTPEAMASVYRQDVDETDSPLYTIVPDRFRLTDLETTPSFAFFAEIDRGHFERGGEAIVDRARFQVTRTIHFRKLSPTAPRAESLEYILFGRGEERFLAHRITTRPDFDQILAVSVTSEDGLTADELDAGQTVVFGDRSPTAPLREGETITGTIGDVPVTLEVVREHYFETGDLSF